MDHSHSPLYRVVRQNCSDPLDISHSRRRHGDYRWNTPEFPALYCCCSEWVARAVALDHLRFAGVDLSDLQPGARPQLVEVEWSGKVIDAASAGGVASAGFPRDYPEGVRKDQTRRSAVEWHSTGAEGVVYRSAALPAPRLLPLGGIPPALGRGGGVRGHRPGRAKVGPASGRHCMARNLSTPFRKFAHVLVTASGNKTAAARAMVSFRQGCVPAENFAGIRLTGAA